MSETTYPEHEKMKALNGASQTAGEFVDWMQGQGIVFAEYQTVQRTNILTGKPLADMVETLMPKHLNIPALLADFFDIDEAKLEAEKQEMIAGLRQ